MRKYLTWQSVSGVVLVLGLVVLYGYTQQQKVSSLQQQIDQLPDGKDKVALFKDRIALENAIAVSVVQGVGGLLLFVTAYVSLQTLQATQRNVSIAQRNLLVSEEKQVTERFTQAINQLGSKEITVRVGGIYALERISKDSEKDYWTIMEVLTSFIREPVQPDVGQSEKQQLTEPLSKIAKDIQAALTVLMRRDLGQDPENKLLDLTGANLVGADLRKTILFNADLSGVNLRSATLSGAILIDATLSGADLREANLFNADLSGATLGGTDLRGAILTNAILVNANLTDATLSGANLVDASLVTACLFNADLSGANLRGANLNTQQVRAAKNWKQANYDDEFRQSLG